MRRVVLFLAGMLLAGLMGAAGTAGTAPAKRPPNILLIYADDIGYGDLGCYGAALRTPNLDRLAAAGLRFTAAYASSATCTPSRYSLLTGEYAFRKRGTGVLAGDAALILDPGRTTLPSLLKSAGFATSVVGKWHLGLGRAGETLDWNGEIRPGPLEVGFDSALIMAATGDRVPCVYVQDREVVGRDPADPILVSYREPFPGEPTGISHRAGLKMDWSHGHNAAVVNDISRIGHMKGGRKARWVDEEMADVFTRKAVRFIEQAGRAGAGRPFFLYFAAHDIHVPRVPHPRFAGKSGMGPRGDAILQFDWCVGELLAALDRAGAAANTLVLCTSDNGPVLDDGYRDDAVEKLGSHRPAGALRGGKYSAFEAGTRVPFMVRWPGEVKPGVSGALVSQVDLLASLASLVGRRLQPADAPDSLDVLPALLGRSPEGRDHVILQAGSLAVRRGPWKYIAPGMGPRVNRNTGIELGNDPSAQLYNLDRDEGERVNRAAEEPARTAELAALLEKIRGAGRSRP